MRATRRLSMSDRAEKTEPKPPRPSAESSAKPLDRGDSRRCSMAGRRVPVRERASAGPSGLAPTPSSLDSASGSVTEPPEVAKARSSVCSACSCSPSESEDASTQRSAEENASAFETAPLRSANANLSPQAPAAGSSKGSISHQHSVSINSSGQLSPARRHSRLSATPQQEYVRQASEEGAQCATAQQRKPKIKERREGGARAFFGQSRLRSPRAVCDSV